MQIPKCSEINLACIKCGCKIETLKDYEDCSANVGIWNKATVATAFSSIKSDLQGCAFVIAVCDDCLKFAVANGHSTQFYNVFDMKQQTEDRNTLSRYIELDLEFTPENN